jgi:hypothetical protein
MQFCSRWQPPVREELPARDAGAKASQGLFAVIGEFLERFYDDADALMLAQAEVIGGLEHSVSVDRLSDSVHPHRL